MGEPWELLHTFTKAFSGCSWLPTIPDFRVVCVWIGRGERQS